MEKLKHVLSTKQFEDPELLEYLFTSAEQMERDDAARMLPDVLRGRILATIFYEPSTRTRFSFEAAMQKLGGGLLTQENASANSSASKGETIADSIRVIGNYADAIVLRHPVEGTAQEAAAISPVPLINAGDGVGEHPTQALLDLYTIRREMGRLERLRVAMIGDLKNGRTIHSLLPLLTLGKEVEVDLVAPDSLRLPEKYVEDMKARGVVFHERDNMDGVLETADVLYVTRVQRERFAVEAEYDAVKDAFRIDTRAAAKMKPFAIIMHALPRVNEISVEVDTDKRAAYFRQAKNGLYLRMALLKYLLG
ncbi:MAG: aspartate carbamoyltransferase [Acidobacteriota bacterium]